MKYFEKSREFEVKKGELFMKNEILKKIFKVPNYQSTGSCPFLRQ